MPRTNYEKQVRQVCDELEQITGTNPLQYIERPGDVPRYVFVNRTCLGGPEALAYVEALREGAGSIIQVALAEREAPE